jgi:hypothetical protein
MRRWYFGAAGVLSAALLVVMVPNLWSGGNTKGEEKQSPPKFAASRIVRVTAYPNSALVTRVVEVPAGEGLAELVVSPLPEHILPNTLYSEAENGIRVLTTRFRTRQVLEDVSEERRKLEAEAEKLLVASSKIDSEIASAQKNMDLLSKLENFTDKTTVLSTEKGGLNGDTVITLVKYVMDQRADKAKELVILREQKRQLDIQRNFLNRKMAELGNGSGRMERDAVVVVDRDGGKGGQVRLNYLVGAVTWRPEYKLRAGKDNEDVKVDCLAGLRQQSGEDWTQVHLTLSTAQPMLNAAPPELAMLAPVLVARGTPGGPPMPTSSSAPEPFFATGGGRPGDGMGKAGFGGGFKDLEDKANQLRSQAVLNYRAGGAKGVGEATRQLNEAAAFEQNAELMRSRDDIIALAQSGKRMPASPTIPGATAPLSNDGPSVTYHLANRLTVPSRNDDQVVEIAKLSLAPKYYYKAVPVLNRHVYRLADLVNKSNYVLLPGEATMYQGSDFVGRMPLPLVAVGEEFTAGFGVDPQVQIQRQLVDKARTTQGGNQVLKYEYRILVSSFKSEPVKLQVWDRLPHAEAESVNVSLVKAAPELSTDAIYLRESRPNNLLRWDLDVAPGRSGEKAVPIAYEFRMELDRQMAIAGFQSK